MSFRSNFIKGKPQRLPFYFSVNIKILALNRQQIR
jgi:hypothetical protein